MYKSYFCSCFFWLCLLATCYFKFVSWYPCVVGFFSICFYYYVCPFTITVVVPIFWCIASVVLYFVSYFFVSTTIVFYVICAVCIESGLSLVYWLLLCLFVLQLFLYIHLMHFLFLQVLYILFLYLVLCIQTSRLHLFFLLCILHLISIYMFVLLLIVLLLFLFIL